MAGTDQRDLAAEARALNASTGHDRPVTDPAVLAEVAAVVRGTATRPTKEVA